ncbi:MAG: biotin/lipoyl-containing protein [Bryobacterales bacterium]|nr:biotin/lipoyl-containing protein [Bryobacterales bacterium]
MTDVLMPQMGESIVEGTLTRWLKQPGDTVARDEPLFEISTDKVDTEIPSPAAGVLKEVLVETGATVQINTVVARIEDGASGGESKEAEAPKAEAPKAEAPKAEEPKAEAAAAPAPAAQESQPAAKAPEPPAETSAEELGPISPLVRRMAREHSIDLSAVPGTGAGGRITKADVEGYLANRGSQAAAPSASAPSAPAPYPGRLPLLPAPPAVAAPASAALAPGCPG